MGSWLVVWLACVSHMCKQLIRTLCKVTTMAHTFEWPVGTIERKPQSTADAHANYKAVVCVCVTRAQCCPLELNARHRHDELEQHTRNEETKVQTKRHDKRCIQALQTKAAWHDESLSDRRRANACVFVRVRAYRLHFRAAHEQQP